MIIGLCGKTKSGKSTCAEYLVKNYGFKELSFADTAQLDKNEVEEDNNILIRSLERQLSQESKTHSKFVISDCRQIPEWKFLLRTGARTVRINRPSSEMKRHESLTNAHPTENELDNINIYTPDHLLINDESLGAFYAKLDLLCEHLGISAINENNNNL